jgi:hypothetical protein
MEAFLDYIEDFAVTSSTQDSESTNDESTYDNYSSSSFSTAPTSMDSHSASDSSTQASSVLDYMAKSMLSRTFSTDVHTTASTSSDHLQADQCTPPRREPEKVKLPKIPSSVKAIVIETPTPPAAEIAKDVNEEGEYILMSGPSTSEERKVKTKLETKLDSMLETREDTHIGTDSESEPDRSTIQDDLQLGRCFSRHSDIEVKGPTSSRVSANEIRSAHSNSTSKSLLSLPAAKSNNLTMIEMTPSYMESVGRHEYYDHTKKQRYLPVSETQRSRSNVSRATIEIMPAHTNISEASYNMHAAKSNISKISLRKAISFTRGKNKDKTRS